MEYPDNTLDDFWLPLPFDNSFEIPTSEKDASEISDARGRFRHTGRYYITKNKESVAIYALIEFTGCDDAQVSILKEEVDELQEEAQRRNLNSLKGSDFGRITGK